MAVTEFITNMSTLHPTLLHDQTLTALLVLRLSESDVMAAKAQFVKLERIIQHEDNTKNNNSDGSRDGKNQKSIVLSSSDRHGPSKGQLELLGYKRVVLKDDDHKNPEDNAGFTKKRKLRPMRRPPKMLTEGNRVDP
uniref:Glycine dehydrogenase [decarboxylating] n=1 Tax=Lygus hesperus TaxID=30085 RepID=A0A0A9XTX9_LYGHE